MIIDMAANCIGRMLLMALAVVATKYTDEYPNDPATVQIEDYQNRTNGNFSIMTTSTGVPVTYDDATVTLNENLIHNMFFMDSFTHFVREKIPERVVHGKAGGARGYFEVTHDITDICHAKLFNKIGKRTPVTTRFSPVITAAGGSDTGREPRGFAVKFYTEDGNYDLLGLSFPMFFSKEAVNFIQFTRALKPNPRTHLKDPNMTWDALTLKPESLFMFLLEFGDRGVPDGYRHMPGFGIHTFQVVNDKGEYSYIRYHILPDAGIKCLSAENATRLAGVDPDYANRDLYDAIASGNFPSWTIQIQVLSPSDVKTAEFDVFDVTKILPLDKYPLRPIGRLVLDKNPTNYFAEVEQIAFCPGNLVPGIVGAPDKLFEVRQLVYRDAHNYRLGPNFNKIRVNCPLAAVNDYNRDGLPPVLDNEGDTPNYYPNTFNGPIPYKSEKRHKLLEIHEEKANNFDQIRDLYANGMSKDEQCRLIQNIVSILSPAIQRLQDRAVQLYTIIHPSLGNRIQQGLLSNNTTTCAPLL